MLTHLRGGIYATQMEELCKTSPFRRSFFRTADGAVSKGGSLWFPFFRPFFVKRQRKGIFAFTERAQLGEAQGEVAESLTKPFTTFSFDAHTALRARSLCCLCLFFALPQRIGEEKALRGTPP